MVRKPCEATPEERPAHKGTHLPFRDWCLHCVSCRASDPAHRLTERAEVGPPTVQLDYQFASEKMSIEISAEQVAVWGLGSGTLVLRGDQETGLTTLLDEIKARRAKTLVQRTVVKSHQPIGAVERMNREVAGLLRT